MFLPIEMPGKTGKKYNNSHSQKDKDIYHEKPTEATKPQLVLTLYQSRMNVGTIPPPLETFASSDEESLVNADPTRPL